MGYDDTVGLIPMIQDTKVHIARGTGKLDGVKKVQVTPHTGDPVQLDGRLAVVLCTGSVPSTPNIPGYREANPWTTRDATSCSYVPEHLIIMGGGAVGAEMSTVFSRFGGKVTVVSSSSEILPGLDPEAGQIVRESLEARGVKFHLGAKITRVERPSENRVVAELSNGQKVIATELVCACGRQANLKDLGLENFGLDSDARFLAVNESLCVKGVDGNWLYAAGDINGRAPLTHISKYHAAVAANAIISKAKGEHEPSTEWSKISATGDRQAMPQVIFTDPVVASCGLTRKAAKAKSKYVREVTASMTSPGYLIHNEAPGKSWAQWLLDENDRLVGATFVGTDAAELLHASTMAIVGGVKLDRMMHAIPSFPTLSWVYYNLMDAAGV